MCGIAGLVAEPDRRTAAAEVERMAATLVCRGPDGGGRFVGDGVAFGHRRLRIVDLTSAADQPMATGDGSLVVTFNGEIYNFRELRDALGREGFAFRSQSDTEVLLHGYRRWGIRGLLERIDGMFAFGLYDVAAHRVFLCRDRFGKKPLYYTTTRGVLRFASEVRAIWATSAELTLDLDSLDYYFAELSMPQPNTIWREVKQVPPATFLSVDPARGTSGLEAYWAIPQCGGAVCHSVDAAVEEVGRQVDAAVLRRTVADVPVGAFLSGGVDSGIVVESLARQLGPGVKTFTVTSGDGIDDEAVCAGRVARRFATDHRQIRVEPHLQQDVQQIAAYFGEPFGDSSAVPSFYVTRAIGEHVRVALSGDGGDEVFGGYHEYAWARQTDLFLERSRGAAARRLRVLGSKILHRLGFSTVNLGHLDGYARRAPWRRLFREMGFEPGVDAVHGPAFDGRKPRFTVGYLSNAWSAGGGSDLVGTLTRASLRTRLLNDYLVKIDRASMMNSVEVRSPLLDTALVSYVLSLPAEVRCGSGSRKALLRRLAARRIDPAVASRPKTGFGIPVGHWLRGELRSFAQEALTSGHLRKSGLVDARVLDRALREHLSAVRDHSDRLWALLMLELWLDRYHERTRPGVEAFGSLAERSNTGTSP